MRASVRWNQSVVSRANICQSSICKTRTQAESLVTQLLGPVVFRTSSCMTSIHHRMACAWLCPNAFFSSPRSARATVIFASLVANRALLGPNLPQLVWHRPWPSVGQSCICQSCNKTHGYPTHSPPTSQRSWGQHLPSFASSLASSFAFHPYLCRLACTNTDPLLIPPRRKQDSETGTRAHRKGNEATSP